MKKFMVTQKFDASSQQVQDAYRAESTWRSFAGLPFVGDPVLRSFEDGDPTTIAMAYLVAIDLPALAQNFIDPDKMTFLERTTLDAVGSGQFQVVPDHYAHLLKASGRIEMVAFDDNYCERLVSGSVDLDLGWAGKLFESPVEDAIVKGFSEALSAQALQIPLI